MGGIVGRCRKRCCPGLRRRSEGGSELLDRTDLLDAEGGGGTPSGGDVSKDTLEGISNQSSVHSLADPKEPTSPSRLEMADSTLQGNGSGDSFQSVQSAGESFQMASAEENGRIPNKGNLNATMDSFFSFTEPEFGVAAQGVRLQSSFHAQVLPNSMEAPTSPRKLKLKKVVRKNTNLVSQFGWVTEILDTITQGRAPNSAWDSITKQKATPLFAVAGTCPNKLCGMQAVTYFRLQNSTVDLWWVKPMKSNAKRLEQKTLCLQNKGEHKNEAGGRARRLYTPLAARFQGDGMEDGDFTFGIAKETGRAFIDERSRSDEGGRMFLYLVWQENWSGAWDAKKWIAGKLCYEKAAPDAPGGMAFFTRQYKITDGEMYIAPGEEEEPLPGMFPPDAIQEMYAMQQ